MQHARNTCSYAVLPLIAGIALSQVVGPCPLRWRTVHGWLRTSNPEAAAPAEDASGRVFWSEAAARRPRSSRGKTWTRRSRKGPGAAHRSDATSRGVVSRRSGDRAIRPGRRRSCATSETKAKSSDEGRQGWGLWRGGAESNCGSLRRAEIVELRVTSSGKRSRPTEDGLMTYRSQLTAGVARYRSVAETLANAPVGDFCAGTARRGPSGPRTERRPRSRSMPSRPATRGLRARNATASFAGPLFENPRLAAWSPAKRLIRNQ
jgi:hypothetical protein